MRARLDRFVADRPALIREVAMKTGGVLDGHDIRTRGNMNPVNVDLRIVVPSEMTSSAAHELAHDVEGRIKREVQEVVDVGIHVEPQNPRLLKL